MDHVTALQERLAERYVLGEMSAVEAEEFESHFFECVECAVAVEDGQVLAANARAVLSEQETETESDGARVPDSRGSPRQSFWTSFLGGWKTPAFGLAATAILAAVSLYQGLVAIPALRHQLGEVRALPSFQLLPASRGEAQRVDIARGTTSFVLAADVPPDAHFPQYVCELSGSQGSAVSRINAHSPALGQPITILVPAANLAASQYELNVYGVDSNGKQGNRISSFGFVLQYH